MWHVKRVKTVFWRCWWSACLLVLLASLHGCIFSSESQQVRETTDAFWQAVLQGDAVKAQTFATSSSQLYLKALVSKRVVAQRFESGEIQIHDSIAEVATVLYGGEKGDLVIPLRTVLVLGEHGWQVDVQKTVGSMVSGAMGAVVDQLNTFMQNDLKDLDHNLSDNVTKFKANLKQGLEQLQQDVTKPSPAPAAQP